MPYRKLTLDADTLRQMIDSGMSYAAIGQSLGVCGATVKRHATLKAKPTLEERFWANVNKDGPIPQHRPELGPCWVWTGGKVRGYGRIYKDGRQQDAHRVYYVLKHGPISQGMECDHLCRNPGCVNDAHIEVVTKKENGLRGNSLPARNKRKTHCDYGHLFDETNTIYGKNGRRNCRACGRIQQREYYRRKKSRQQSNTATA